MRTYLLELCVALAAIGGLAHAGLAALPLGEAISVERDAFVEISALDRGLAIGVRPRRGRRPRDAAALQRDKARLAGEVGSGSPALPAPKADAAAGPSDAARALVPGPGFEGLRNADNASIAHASALPPDSNLGVGPAHVFEMVNLVGRITDKAGAPLATFSLPAFFGTDPGTFDTDPRVIYDVLSGRWFATYAQSTSSASSIVLAVSTSADPTGTFCRYRLGNPASETFLQDFPQVAVSADKVVVTYNAFTLVSENFLGAAYYVINKNDVLGCALSISTVRVPPDSSRYGEYPAQSLSSASDLRLAMNNDDSVTVFTVSGVPGVSAVGETAVTLGIRSWTAPPNAPQAGSAVLLDTNDESVVSAMWRAGSLWIAGNERCRPPGDGTTRSCLRVIEIRTDTATVQQDMTVSTAGEYYYYPAVALDDTANLYVVFTASSASEFASVRATAQYAGDPLNTIEPAILIRPGGGAQTSSMMRMGDYSGAAADPAQPGTVWVVGEYIQSTGNANWGTFLSALTLTPSALAAAILPSSRTTLVNVPATVFATVINGGSSPATAVDFRLRTPVPVEVSYQTTDPATNQPIGHPNTPVDIPAGASQTYVLTLTPTAAFSSAEITFTISGSDTAPVGLITGVNTLLLAGSTVPAPDIVALAATLGNDGIVNVPGPNGTGVFAVATINLGVGTTVTVSTDTGSASLPILLFICQTQPATGVCMTELAPTVTVPIAANATPTFAIFVRGVGTVAFDPATARIFVRLTDAAGLVSGLTSVAVQTLPQ